MVQSIVDFFNKIVDSVKPDYILYGAAGLTLAIFFIVLFCAAGAAKFKKAAAETVAYLKSNTGTEQLDERMEKFPKAVRGAWKNYRASNNAAVAVYLPQNICVDSGSSGKLAAMHYFFGVLATAALAFLLNILIWVRIGFAMSYVSSGEAVAPLIVLILGVILTVVLHCVNKSRYNKAVAAYNDLIGTLNNYLPGAGGGAVLALPVGTTVLSETYDSASGAPEFKTEEKPEPEVKAEPAAAPAEHTAPAAPPPVFVPQYYGPQTPEKEDIIVQIERITAAGASKQTMLEVAKLLQAERAKAENKTPEQQKRLNAALATLLKAISSAN